MFTQTPELTAQKRRLTVAEYHWLGEHHFFQPGERVELIQGELVTMAAKGTRHTVCWGELNAALADLVQPGLLLQGQNPISLPDSSEPEPDFAILRLREDRYITGHPTPADIVLVIEIADSSLAYDREVKGRLYAQSGINDYWLFDVVNKQVEVYRQPRAGLYKSCAILFPEETISLPEFPERILALSPIFGWW
ncbi:Uncharacterized protein conserved in cyanobacteria [Gloeomargarita lithophora Alchichica-D10]|uniref:Uncharacterized protein conserved in cyanobacteria n=1 Tax=Gloeomargarita lithophora Alchichica-D10 TaxID=1188229 RepID=A0A1J0AF78_9CYAN|nr:Uma2 family endonuclease [Gloeomargarita lithophora]APB34596.1 Uncharacterized protein conserved in cyanobacteria [Gloeomargarita lithophora Alchichica-D10]